MEGHFLRCVLLINFIQIGFAQRLIRRDICLLDVAEGSCLDDLPRFYYNTLTQTCEEFSYGGCEGNANNFKSFVECHKTCHSIPKIPTICRFPKDEGHCFGIGRRYFFNMTSMLCEAFSYGGCGGNNNNFRDQHLCMEYCSPPKAVHVICLDPLDRGTGNAAIPRYYYDSTKKTCKQFEYSGSGGNNNNFLSVESCLKVCAQKNKQQKLPGRRIRVFRKRT